MTGSELWQAALAELELSMSKANFTTWLKNTFILEYTENKVIIGVPNTFTKTWLENKYHSQIFKALQNITDYKIKDLSYKVASLKDVEAQPQKKEEVILPSAAPQTTKTVAVQNKNINNPGLSLGFNPRYTFENFVVGKKNELAHAAALAVAEKPGKVYNPLFIYGGVGLGKTHLMQAVGHKILENNPQVKILYTTCENFTNEYIRAVSLGQADKFKDKYRSVDVLMIDDIQFLAGKEGTQEAFFHTFNHLHQSDKQILLTSDRPPKAIPTLEGRLTSRFEWGMIVDIGAPDLETRTAILKFKCREKNYELPDEIINFLSASIQSNIRELEGALNRIIATNQLQNRQPNLEEVKNLLNSIVASPKKNALTAKKIIQTVANYFEIKIIELTGACRKKELVVPRQIVMYLMREEMHSSYPNIGQELGGRDHTTAMHACNKITREIELDEKLQQDINLIKQRLYS